MKIFYVLTNLSCNLACSYCYENLTGRVNNAKDICDYLLWQMEKEKFTDDTLMLDIIGGEPFLVPDLCDTFMEFTLNNMGKFGFKRAFFGFSTNGTLLTTPRVKKLLDKYKDGILISVSIDGKKDLHDSNRVTRNGLGSFDKALEGFLYAKSVLPSGCQIKATYTRDNIHNYAEHVKYLLSLNPSIISAGFTFEEVLDEYDGIYLALQLTDVCDYIVSSDYKGEFQLLYKGIEGFYLSTNPLVKDKPSPQLENACGACVHMKSIGFDRKVYGCQRFISMGSDNMEMGVLDQNNKLIVRNKETFKNVENFYKYQDDVCKKCPMQKSCCDCLAVPYEVGATSEKDLKEYRSRREQCGWSKAKAIAKDYGYRLMKHKKAKFGELYNENFSYSVD